MGVPEYFTGAVSRYRLIEEGTGYGGSARGGILGES